MKKRTAFTFKLLSVVLAGLLLASLLSGCFLFDLLQEIGENLPGVTAGVKQTEGPQVTPPVSYTIKDNAPGEAVLSEADTAAVPEEYRSDFITIKNAAVQFNDSVTITKQFSGMNSSNYKSYCQQETDRLLGIAKLINYTCPELFYLGKNYHVQWHYSGSGNSATFTVQYTDMYQSFGTKAQIQAMNAEVQAEMDKITALAKAYPNSFARELFVHDYLVKKITYTKDESKNYIRNIYGALVKGEGVCEAYARAFQALMQRLGEKVYVLEGAADSEDGKANHMWNLILLYGQLYQVDVTWDDTLTVADPNDTSQDALISHAYFNQTDAFVQMTRTYMGEDQYYPFSDISCTSQDFNYFRIKGLLCDSIEVYEAVVRKLRDSFPEGSAKCIEVQFTCPVTEEQVKAAVSAVRLQESAYKYSYNVNSETGIVRVYNWQNSG